MNKEINNLSKKILLFSFLNLVSFSISAQPTYQKLFSNDTTSYMLKDITPTSDGDYLLSGSNTNSTSFYNPFLLKINPTGEVIYTKKLSLFSSHDTIANYAIIPLENRGYALAGSAIGFLQYVNGAGFRDILYTCTLNENEEYVGARVYNHNGVIF